MAYPGEREHLEYLEYVESYSLGEAPGKDGRVMSKKEWREWKKQNQSAGDQNGKKQPGTSHLGMKRIYS